MLNLFSDWKNYVIIFLILIIAYVKFENTNLTSDIKKYSDQVVSANAKLEDDQEEMDRLQAKNSILQQQSLAKSNEIMARKYPHDDAEKATAMFINDVIGFNWHNNIP